MMKTIIGIEANEDNIIDELLDLIDNEDEEKIVEIFKKIFNLGDIEEFFALTFEEVIARAIEYMTKKPFNVEYFQMTLCELMKLEDDPLDPGDTDFNINVYRNRYE